MSISIAALPYVLLFISLYFEVFLLVSFLERRFGVAHASAGTSTEKLPTVAIVVPTLNEEKTVVSTIRSLLSLSYPADKLELIVVDDGSTDGTLSAIEQFRSDARIRIFSKENGGKHTAMNYALERTNAELIGCLDADSSVAPGALAAAVPVFGNPLIAAVTPGIHVRTPENFLQHLQHVEYRLSIFNRFIFAALGSAFITPGPFSIFRTSVVRELGGWRHGHSTEDMEMALRMQEHGYHIANQPSAVVYTATPRSLGHLFRQRVRWTYGFLRNARDYRHMLWNRSYGNLGLIVLPAALISIATGLYFFARALLYLASTLYHEILQVRFSGTYPYPEFSMYYVNTSALIFLVYIAVILIVVLISMGSYVGTGSRKLPAATPLFLLFYGFLAPLWLGTALVRATLRTGVRWR